MGYKVESIRPFDRQLRRLAKKFPSLVREYGTLLDALEANPETGTPIGHSCYKIRMAIASKGAGKRGRRPRRHLRAGGEQNGIPVGYLR